jgi:recombination protein RecT
MSEKQLALQKHLQTRSLISQFTANRYDNTAKFAVERDYALSIIAGNKKLVECSPNSIGRCIIDVGVMGVSLSPTRKEAYLIPYFNSSTGETICTLSISYMGMEQLAYRTGLLSNIQTNVVREGDSIKVFTKDNKRQVEHVESMTKRGKVTHVYCIATFKDGSTHVETMDRKEIMGARSAAAKKNNGTIPFTWAEKNPFRYEMYKKAVLRRAWKHWPKSNDKQAELIRSVVERQDPVDFTPAVPKDETPGEVSITVTDEMIEKLNKQMDDAGILPAQHDRWLNGLAKSMGYQSPQAIKVADFETAQSKLEEGIASWVERTQGDKNAQTTD